VHRHSLRPLIFGAKDDASLGHFVPRECECSPSPRHCEERQRRSNPEYLRGCILDCFAALAMTEKLFDS
jgi:hypothetical protein